MSPSTVSQSKYRHIALWSAGVFIVQAIILSLTPLVASAAAPQDTYSWVKNVSPVQGCSEPMSPISIMIAASKVYTYDRTTNSVEVFDTNGNLLLKFGSQGSGDGQFNYGYGYAEVVAGTNGDIYVLDTGNHRVQRFSASGTYVSQFGTSGNGTGQFNDTRNMTIDSSGNLYVEDSDGSGNTRIQKFDSDGNFLLQFTAKAGGTGHDMFTEGMTTSSSGDLYLVGTTTSTGSNLDTTYVQHYTSTGTYISQFGGAQGTGNGQFGVYGFNMDIRLDSTGNIYVLDGGNSRVEVFNSAGTYISQFGTQGSGNGQYSNNAWGLALDSSDNVYVADANNHRIEKTASTGVYIGEITYDPNNPTMLCGANDIAIDSAGNYYITDYSWDNIKVYNPSGTLLRTIGSSGSGNGQLKGPSYLTLDSADNIYVSDTYNNRIEKFSANGTYLAQFGSSGAGNGQFNYPQGITLDAAGNIYVVDSNNYRVEKFDSAGNYMMQFSALDTNGWLEDVAIDTAGNIYVLDSGNYRVEKHSASGAYLSQFGSGGTGDGQFTWPDSIAIDATGSILISDEDKYIKKFDSTGVYLSKFGQGGSSESDLGTWIPGLAIDGQGTVYALDSNNNRISIWAPNTPPSPPSDVVVTALSRTSVAVSWVASRQSSIFPVLGYRVMYRAVGSPSWIQASDVSPTTNRFVLSGLNSTTEYEVQVIAYSATGLSASNGSVVSRPSDRELAQTGQDMRIVVIIACGLVIAGVSLLVGRYRLRRRVY